MNKDVSLIIGAGQVGKSLRNVLKKEHKVYLRDLEDLELKRVDFLHICFPFSKGFAGYVKNYIKQYQPRFVIIHSTVPVGITRKCGENIWHSPVRGVHPNLEVGILIFKKYIGGEYNKEIEDYFEKVGVELVFFDKPETTEALKLWSTTQYGLFVIIQKEIYKWCQENNLDFDKIYTEANKTYNEGYLKLGRPEVIRPILKQIKGEIGGHCILQNAEMLDSDLSRFFLRMNKKFKV